METAQLLDDIRSEIRRRALPKGGWTSAAGSQASVEATCLALMALRRVGKVSDLGRHFLLRMQNANGGWPAFQRDDSEGCWTTSLAVITIRGQEANTAVHRGVQWLLLNSGRESYWFWNLKFRFGDRKVQFDPHKYGWPWFPGTVSWVIPTAFGLIALKQSLSCCRVDGVKERIQLGTDMLFDRACPDGGWNAGNGVVLGSPLKPHIDPTAISLLALTESATHATTRRALSWLQRSLEGCSSAYSLAWAALALATHETTDFAPCTERLSKALLSRIKLLNTETLSVASIALGIGEGDLNPFHTVSK
jgi:hypothetical protein